MKSYSAIGYSLIALHIACAAVAAPDGWGPVAGAAAGLAYLLFTWALSGLYVAQVLHMGLAHRALEFKGWFLDFITVTNSIAGIYVDPRSWVNRHRNHHAFSDQLSDPSKRPGDGFWRTLWLCLAPHPCRVEMAPDDVFRTPVFRLACHPLAGWLGNAASFLLLWLVVAEAVFAVVLWTGARVIALWINMIQNYWTHDRRFGTRRYDDTDDDSVNITEWLPVTATFSACMQNNHHRYARYARMSHEPRQYDFGWMTLRWMAALGLARVLPEGAEAPTGARLSPLPALGNLESCSGNS
jgi:fatty-acid desaturase